ncbi:MAG TPA: hypothetical protein DCS19_03815 [Flavobacterium sp.]|nr:hypothetical protein [Flavobacterium sp.]
MNIGLIDNDLCSTKKQHYPNLALMKLSSYHKNNGDNVKLIPIDEMNGLFQSQYDKVYCAKVFSDTETPEYLQNKGIIFGGSGFYFDKAEKLPYEIEHTMPDYNLYSDSVIKSVVPSNRISQFKDFSIGFTTRGCIRKCDFCINRNETKVYRHSNVSEFLDETRPFIMLWDDNIIAFKEYEKVFAELNETNKPFIFKQGMDFRLFNKHTMDIVFNSNYFSYGGKKQNKAFRIFHFAFDNIKDAKKIEENLILYHKNRSYACRIMFYVLIGFDRGMKYDNDFYKEDFESLLFRIKILFKYRASPYIMCHENYKKSPLLKHIEAIRKICNYPVYITGKTIRQALEMSNLTITIEYLNSNYEWFLSLKLDSLLGKIDTDTLDEPIS